MEYNTEKDKEELYTTIAKGYLKKHGLEHYQFKLTNSYRLLGTCNSTRKIITLSKHHIKYSKDCEIIDTIKHEISHALADMLYGQDVGHDKRWKLVASIVGATPKRISKQGPPHKYEIMDTRNGKLYDKYFRKPKGWRNISTTWHLKSDPTSKGHLRLVECEVIGLPTVNKGAYAIKRKVI